MEQKQKYMLVAGLLVGMLLIGVGAFFVVGSGGSASSSSDGGSNTMFIIMISQIPIWISLLASKEARKKKKAEGRKQKEDNLYDLSGEIYFEDKVLSAYDGEIVAYDELEGSQKSSYQA